METATKETTMSTASSLAQPHQSSDGRNALILGVLAVPGSTIAWDLPLGGLWIGLPLAILAIVLGLRARREGSSPRMATAGILLAGLCILQMAVWTIASIAS